MVKNFKAVIVVFKPANQWQIESIFSNYNITEFTIFYQGDDNRLDEATIQSWHSVKNFKGTINIHKLPFLGLTKRHFRKILEEQGDFHLLGMPLFVGYKFWGNVLWAKNKSAIVANVFDGSIENTNISDSFLRLKTKGGNFYSLLKLYVLPKLIFLFGRADVAYSPYYPLYSSCFAKKTLSEISTLDEDKRKLLVELLNGEKLENKYLMIAGYEATGAYISNVCGKNYIATTKEKAIIINGEKIETPYYICVEELLHVFKPKYAIGYTSDAIVAVKNRYMDVPCFAIRSDLIVKTWGDLYNKIYEKQTEKFKIKVIDLNEVNLLMNEFT